MPSPANVFQTALLSLLLILFLPSSTLPAVNREREESKQAAGKRGGGGGRGAWKMELTDLGANRRGQRWKMQDGTIKAVFAE